MRKLALGVALCFLLTPALSLADDDGDDRDGISATEMATTGLVAAGLIGVAGYLILRRRRTTQRP